MSEKWYHNRKRAFLLDFQMPDSSDQMPIGQPVNLRHIDPEAIVATLKDSGVEALYVHAKDNQGNCYFNTGVGHKHTGIGDKDLMKEFSAACRKADMSILYYVQLTRERRGHAEASYAARHADGSPVVIYPSQGKPFNPTIEQAPVMCLNGPGREYMLNIVRELSAGYDFDGFWLDCFGWWGQTVCYCDICKSKYLEDTGKMIPPPDVRRGPEWTAYFTWRRRMNRIILHEIERTILSINPRLTITHNNGAVYTYEDWAMSDLDDYVTNECQNQDGFGNLGLLCRKNRSVKGEAPFEIELWRFNSKMLGISREYQVRPVPQLQAEMAIIAANGGFIQYYDQIKPDGGIDARSMQNMKKAFDIVKPVQEALPSAQSPQQRVKYASIVWSKPTENMLIDGKLGKLHNSELEGFSTALMESRVLFDLITDRDVKSGKWGGAKVIALPNVVCLSDREAEQLREYVRQGGGIVATYRTSLCDEAGRPRSDFGLGDLFGAEYQEPMSFLYSYMQFEEPHELLDGLPLQWPISNWDKLQLKVRPLTGATPVGRIVNPMRGMHMGYPAQETTEYAPIVTNRVGQGRVVYIAAPLGELYDRYGHEDTKTLIANAVRWAAGEAALVEIDGPPTLECVLWRESGSSSGLLLHLVNTAGAGPLRVKNSSLQQVLPVYDIQIRLNRRINKAVMLPNRKVLEVEATADKGSIIRIQRLDVYTVIHFE